MSFKHSLSEEVMVFIVSLHFTNFTFKMMKWVEWLSFLFINESQSAAKGFLYVLMNYK